MSTTRCTRRPASGTCSCRRWGPRRSFVVVVWPDSAASPRLASLRGRRGSTGRHSPSTRRTRPVRSPSTSGSGSGPRCVGPTTVGCLRRVRAAPRRCVRRRARASARGRTPRLVDGPLLPARRECVPVPSDAPLHPQVLRCLDPDQQGDEVGEAGRPAAHALDDQQGCGIDHDLLGELPGHPVVAAVGARPLLGKWSSRSSSWASTSGRPGQPA